MVAKVGEHYMTFEDLKNAIPDNLSPEDSTEMASNIIQNWVNRELMFDKAKFNLHGVEQDIENRVENYRKELYIFAFEKEQVAQKLDTIVLQNEINTFYAENPDIFQLNDYILKVRYVKLKHNSPGMDKVEQWIDSEDEEDLELLKEYSHKYAVKFYNDTNWVFFNDLLRELPIEVYNKESFLRSDNVVTFEDSEHVYFLSIRELQSKNTLSPITLEQKRIKHLILNKRKLELLSNIRRKLYQDAVSQGNVVIYEKPQLLQ